MKTENTINNLFLEIFGKENETMIAFITPEILESFKFKTQDFLREKAKELLSKKMHHNLIHMTGNRLEIIDKSIKETPFYYHFSLIKKLGNGECETTKKHLYYFLYHESDMHESETHYTCIYCGKKGIGGKRNCLDGETARTTYKPGEKLERGKNFLKILSTTNPSQEEIQKFANIIVDIAF